MAEHLHSQRKAGGPLWAARDAYSMFSSAPFLWRAPATANDNPAPLAKRLARLGKLVLIITILGLLGYAAAVL